MSSFSQAQPTILLIAVDSTDTARSRLEQESQDIAIGLQRSPQQKPFHLEHRLVTTPRDIQRAMLDIEPQIVHFSGYEMGDAGLLFADATGEAKPIAREALATLFALFAEQVQCVVLNGCYSSLQGQAIAQHIPYVIGVNAAIGNSAAIEFMVTFYDALGSGRPVDFAYKLACSALQLSGIAAHLMPVLLKGAIASPSDLPTTTPASPAVSPAPAPGNTFNIAGSTITNLTGSGAINYQESMIQPIASEHPQPALPLSKQPNPPAPTVADKTLDKPHSEDRAARRAIELFFSYSHRDEDLRDEMAKHLSILKRQGVISTWHDRSIDAGTEWAQEIDSHLNSAQVILLLISPDFIASDYCFDIEMGRAMERHEAGEACVIPVILRPVDWSGAPFSKLQAYPKNAKPVTTWANQDEAFLNVTQGIRNAVERLSS
ncbi:MAG TPA: TIR domain-containing protein [Chroococcidiopsis sp.]